MSDILSDILPVTLVIAVAVFKIVSGAKKKSAQTKDVPPYEPKEEIEEPYVGENFPEIDIVPEPRVPKKETPKPRNIQKDKKHKAVVLVEPANRAEEERPQPAKERIRINTKSEAKKAIIYSEIFNKKY